MLYWAEGSKNRNVVALANGDVDLVRFFCFFLRKEFALEPEDLRVTLNFYTGNGLSQEEIESYWLGALELPRTCLRKPTVDQFPKSSKRKRGARLPYGVCRLSAKRSTYIVQHIFGAIQQYGGFDAPSWLD
jgi:hypothetical protein